MSNTTVTRPASEKQISFAKSLIEKRVTALEITDLDAYLAAIPFETITSFDISKVINHLKTIPADPEPVTPEKAHLPAGYSMENKFKKPCTKCGEAVEAGSGWVVKTDKGWQTFHALDDCAVQASELETVERGYYAIPSLTGTNDLDFFWVHVRNGSLEVLRILGGHGPQRMTNTESRKVARALAALTDEQALEAHARYGQEIGSCGVCGRHLTDEASRAAGLGPECAKG